MAIGRYAKQCYVSWPVCELISGRSEKPHCTRVSLRFSLPVSHWIRVMSARRSFCQDYHQVRRTHEHHLLSGKEQLLPVYGLPDIEASKSRI